MSDRRDQAKGLLGNADLKCAKYFNKYLNDHFALPVLIFKARDRFHTDVYRERKKARKTPKYINASEATKDDLEAKAEALVYQKYLQAGKDWRSVARKLGNVEVGGGLFKFEERVGKVHGLRACDCLYCGVPDHQVATCPEFAKDSLARKNYLTRKVSHIRSKASTRKASTPNASTPSVSRTPSKASTRKTSTPNASLARTGRRSAPRAASSMSVMRNEPSNSQKTANTSNADIAANLKSYLALPLAPYPPSIAYANAFWHSPAAAHDYGPFEEQLYEDDVGGYDNGNKFTGAGQYDSMFTQVHL